jgi:hypothetical protein
MVASGFNNRNVHVFVLKHEWWFTRLYGYINHMTMDGSFWINRKVHVFLLKQECWFTRLYGYITVHL